MRKLQECSLGECYTPSYLRLNPTCVPLLTVETRDSLPVLSPSEIQIWKQHCAIQRGYPASLLEEAGGKRAGIVMLLTLNQQSCQHVTERNISNSLRGVDMQMQGDCVARTGWWSTSQLARKVLATLSQTVNLKGHPSLICSFSVWMSSAKWFWLYLFTGLFRKSLGSFRG